MIHWQNCIFYGTAEKRYLFLNQFISKTKIIKSTRSEKTFRITEFLLLLDYKMTTSFVNFILFCPNFFKNKTKTYFSTSFTPHIPRNTKPVPNYKEIGSPKLTHNPFLNSDLPLPLLALFFHSLHGIFSTPLHHFQLHLSL